MIRNIKIFLVDNDLFKLDKLRQGLNDYGYKNLNLFLNGTICINNLHQNPNIVFLNLPIDDSSGFELLKKIKLHHPDIYVIIISNQENVTLAVDVIKHGAFEYISNSEDIILKMINTIERVFSLD